MSKTQRWEWAVSLKLEELDDSHLQAAYKLNWDNLCKFDNCRKNCKRILCLACFDRSWIDNDNGNNSNYDNFETAGCEQKRNDLETFVGLKNLGATCYVNCLLQLWFHNPALRKAIYEWEKDSSGSDLDKSTGNPLAVQDSNFDDNDVSMISSSKTKSRDDKTPQTKKVVSKSSTEKKQNQVIDPQDQTLARVPANSPTQNKSKDSLQTNPIEQLQLIFARLQFTNKKSIDPFNFIDSLALNAAEQQDAQEFGNLFMEFLEKSFANQKNSFVSKIIQRQFCGSYSYVTTCDHCKHSSFSESKFYELDLSIQNLETLHDCLAEYFRPAPLDGKYNCGRCKKAQSAHRKIVLKSLPPTLNLQLLRFVYDKQRCVRQKLNSYIIFPEILDMSSYLKDSNQKTRDTDSDPLIQPLFGNSNSLNGFRTGSNKSNIYILSAVLIHRGSSPHSGHYIAHIKDRVSKNWFKFNDDSVERIGPQLQVSSDGESITIVDDKTQTIRVNSSNGDKSVKLESKSLKSKTAYMLVYQAKDDEALSYPSDHSEGGWILPDHLQIAVAEENSRSEEIFESLQIAKEVDQQAIELRKNQVKTIYEKLVCRDPKEKFEFIDRIWLQNWLTNSSSNAKFSPIDNSHLICNHDKLDFRKLDQVKCVRSEGADLLYSEYGGGPRLADAMCKQCVELEVKLIQLKEELKEHQKFITSQSKFKLDANYDFADAYLVGRKSYRDWQQLVMCQFEKSHPELLSRKKDNKSDNQHASSDEDDQKVDSVSDKKTAAREKNNNNIVEDASESDSDDEAIEKFVFNSDVLCEHNQLIAEPNAWRIVPKEVWNVFKKYFSDDLSRPLLELNANTMMCADCKQQEVEQQEIGDIQRGIASRQKSKLPDLFHNRKRASWCSMLPGDVYYALDRQFLSKWQKFLRNPSNQEQPETVNNKDRLICEHGKSLYNHLNSSPILPECPFVLISPRELENLKEFYPVNQTVQFTIDQKKADKKLELYLATRKSSANKKSSHMQVDSLKQLDNAGDHEGSSWPAPPFYPDSDDVITDKPLTETTSSKEEELDLEDIDWSDCVVSEPDFCSQCHEILKQDELKKLLNYESATIYITKVENNSIFGPQNQPNGSGTINNENCDSEMKLEPPIKKPDGRDSVISNQVEVDNEEVCPFKRRRKIYLEDEANDFVPPGASKQSTPNSTNSSMLRRTTRRNRNREQAYTIKPNQTLLELKKEIFSRCQVLPVDQRLFLNSTLLDDNSKTMSELSIVPNCSLKLEVDKPVADNIDLIEDEPSSRKSCAQPETGFKGSLLLSNSHL